MKIACGVVAHLAAMISALMLSTAVDADLAKIDE